jgi:hypothetical protein
MRNLLLPGITESACASSCILGHMINAKCFAMSSYRMSADGEWIRINPDGSKWEISEDDKEKYQRSLGRSPRPYRGGPSRVASNNHNGIGSTNQAASPNQESSIHIDPSVSSSNHEPALGTDLELPLPECYEPLALPIHNDNFGAYRLVELKERHIAYKGQYRIFRQYIKSPGRIDLDKERNGINTWSAAASPPKVQTGKRGGRFTIAVTKEGRYYRRYF